MMAHTERNFTLQRILVTFLVYQGFIWIMPRCSQAFVPLDDEDFIKGKGRAARSSSGSCRSGWDEFGDKCYLVLGIDATEQKNWHDANKQCRYLRSTLVSVHSREEQDYLYSKFSYSSSLRVWLGLHRRYYRADYIWADGSPLDFEYWNTRYPNPRNRGKACVQMQVSLGGKWSDVSCRYLLPYICQSFKGSKERSLDESSGDGEETLCSDVFCHNGGSCVDDTTIGNFQCICAEGYHGERCEERTGCTDDACENGGSCVVDAEVGDIKCNCMDGYNGERCEERDSIPGFDISEYIYIIGAVAAVISLIIIIVVFVLIKRSRNRGKNANDNVARPTEETSVAMSSCRRTQSQE